jgi:hypothetical protein
MLAFCCVARTVRLSLGAITVVFSVSRTSALSMLIALPHPPFGQKPSSGSEITMFAGGGVGRLSPSRPQGQWPVLCRFSDAGKTCFPRADACQCDLMAAVRMIALGQKIAESTLKARPMRCAAAPPLASSRHTGPQPHPKSARTTRTNPHSARCPAGCPTHRDFVPWRFSDAGRARASQNGGGRCGGGSMVPAS